MAEPRERRKTPRKATSKPDTRAAAPRKPQRVAPESGSTEGNLRTGLSQEEARRLIAEAAYYRAKQRGFAPGRELEDWFEAESEVMGRINGADAEPRR